MIYASERDVFTFLRGIADDSYDAVVTDFPYPTLERHRSRGTTVRLQDWFKTLSIKQLVDVLAEMYRVLKPNSYAFVFVDADSELLLASALGVPAALTALVEANNSSAAPKTTVGFNWWPSLTWVKTGKDSDAEPETMTDDDLCPGMGYHGRRCSEKILVLEKGKRRLLSFNNVFCAPRYYVKPPLCPQRATTPKPPSIVRDLVQASTDPEASVLDPFVGCGAIAEGIRSAGRHAVVNDINLSLFREWMQFHFKQPFTEF